jgi:hypothetical protein
MAQQEQWQQQAPVAALLFALQRFALVEKLPFAFLPLLSTLSPCAPPLLFAPVPRVPRL